MSLSLKRRADSPTPTSPSRFSKRRKRNMPPSSPEYSSPAYSAYFSSSYSSYPSSSNLSLSHLPLFPSDSPTNPFGRTRTLNTSLPQKTTFGRHLPLRFQFLRHGVKRDFNNVDDPSGREGIYRIVQVPLNYTFQHLRALVAFLFGGRFIDLVEEGEDADEDDGHLFEIREGVVMYSKHYLPGTIKKSETVVRLSNSKDPYRYKGKWDYENGWKEEGEFSNHGNEGKDDEGSEAEGETNVKWEAEEDYTLGHVWKPALRGQCPDDKTAIVYLHPSDCSPAHPTQVQITLHKDKIPIRRGIGNTPYVFEGRGHVFLNTGDANANEFDEEEVEGEEDLEMDIDPDSWNDPESAFKDFLVGCLKISPPCFDFDKEPQTQTQAQGLSSSSRSTCTPGLINDVSSSPVRQSSLLPSTPGYLPSSPVRGRTGGNLSPTSAPAEWTISNIFAHGKNKATTSSISLPITGSVSLPLPPPRPPSQRKRMAYLRRRIERSKSRVRKEPIVKDGEKLSEDDEEDKGKAKVKKVPKPTRRVTRAARVLAMAAGVGFKPFRTPNAFRRRGSRQTGPIDIDDLSPEI
ncbi:hypothetical protein D9757_006054 [Collybiopsis confluens]|uniref:Uncharacterized protein n=1 Tax=Collybiopsis confluens TaxID=2823264 RepID=A0A8H5HU82_9AGAR|nr:hypothetical protein D9757_006054 [Collybiopsis confluens]